MLSPTVLGVTICVAAAVLERTRRPRCSSAAGAASHAALFPTIRTLACYRFPVLCDVFRDFAPCAQHRTRVALAGFCASADGCALTRERVLERAFLPLVRLARELYRIHSLCGSSRRTGYPSC